MLDFSSICLRGENAELKSLQGRLLQAFERAGVSLEDFLAEDQRKLRTAKARFGPYFGRFRRF